MTDDPVSTQPPAASNSLQVSGSELLTYRPRRMAAAILAGAFIVGAAALAVVGMVLVPNDLKALEGFQRLLFTVVPVRPFAWACAVVFLILAARIWLRSLSTEPTLVVSDTGLILRDGQRISWADIDAVEVTAQDILRITRASAPGTTSQSTNPPRRWNPFQRKRGAVEVCLSAFELGTAPGQVRDELTRRMSRP